jgi:hypothetical protein
MIEQYEARINTIQEPYHMIEGRVVVDAVAVQNTNVGDQQPVELCGAKFSNREWKLSFSQDRNGQPLAAVELVIRNIRTHGPSP